MTFCAQNSMCLKGRKLIPQGGDSRGKVIVGSGCLGSRICPLVYFRGIIFSQKIPWYTFGVFIFSQKEPLVYFWIFNFQFSDNSEVIIWRILTSNVWGQE